MLLAEYSLSRLRDLFLQLLSLLQSPLVPVSQSEGCYVVQSI